MHLDSEWGVLEDEAAFWGDTKALGCDEEDVWGWLSSLELRVISCVVG